MWPKYAAAGVDGGDIAGMAGELASYVEEVGAADRVFDDNGQDVPDPGGAPSGAGSRGCSAIRSLMRSSSCSIWT